MLGAGETCLNHVFIPVDVLLSLPMFLRLYIAFRYLILHSAKFQDPGTKAMAGFNQVTVDFPFVVRSQLNERPLFIVTVSTAVLWLIMAWMLTQCERYCHPDDRSSYRHIGDFIWFEVVTFFSIGYGDVQVKTYCGRALAILTGIIGTMMSSLLIALVGRMMQLSLSERRVNQVIAESQLTTRYKNSAARVLQNTWRVIKQKRLVGAAEDNSSRPSLMRLRLGQRNFLRAITQ
ncbi:hypothetical protein AB6A40_003189 [Gnathostoma spinigerum]|uniref:Uncharacterized protein n=1 Tax=Gnathostoma spinigerum TaxID=75299 RepID=A0ABD6EA03_9BILA